MKFINHEDVLQWSKVQDVLVTKCKAYLKKQYGENNEYIIISLVLDDEQQEYLYVVYGMITFGRAYIEKDTLIKVNLLYS